ncbi:RNA polymerase sigma-70 factor [Streptomyces sp. NPDC054861]
MNNDQALDRATEAFVTQRNLLFTVAYEMLGSTVDAEATLQETWLRWVEVDLEQVRDQSAYLVRIATRQALDRLRTQSRRKESYAGLWLPKPLSTAPDVAQDVDLAERVSVTVMLALETLSPTERAVFVLREVFDIGYDEIAASVDETTAAVRQIAHLARRHVGARRPREVVSQSKMQAALELFMRALERSDLQGLRDVLAPEAVYLPDGGGVKHAALRPIVGADRVARLLAGSFGRNQLPITFGPTMVNGSPALAVHLDGQLDGIMAARVEGGRISNLYFVRNPEKLSHLKSEPPCTRQ